ncbi:putative isomerase [Vibrio ishigakensis]|uniref:Putative isomerase n=2 Tax=Vibrio ishigakensis TaxID=1481914 RepID=A0A0B8P3B4_9VIBR|nr:putative isomerase [Vibrio ishigakensis]
MGWGDKTIDGAAIEHEERYTNFCEIYVDPEVKGDNPFINKPPANKELPKFADIKAELPQLSWDANSKAVAGYYKTWEIAFGNLRQPTESNGFVSNFIDTAFNNHLFMWDSAFITMFGKYAHHCFEFIGTLDNLYAKQMMDGFIGRELSIETGQNHFHRHDPTSTGPNILPWAEWQHYEMSGDKERLAQVFVPILALHRWIADNRTWKDGTYWGCGWSCGMDNQLRVDKKKYDFSHHSHSSWIDVTLHQYLSATLLLKMQQELGTDEDLSDIQAEIVNLKKVVNEKMWDESRQFYFDTLRDDSFSSIKSIGPYWALLTDMVPKERLQSFIAHLDDERSFKRPHRIPTMSADCEHYTDNGDYWRGGVWAPTNYMVLKGLEKHGYHDLAFDIA